MRPADAHLNPQEFELLLFGVANSSIRNAGSPAALQAQQHLDVCAVCQATAERYRNAEEMLKSLETGNKASFQLGKEPTRGPECLDEQTWLSVAAGLIAGDEAKRYIAHAAICDWCGPLLKEGMEDLAQDVTPEEEEVLAMLPSASSAWQHEMGKKLAAANRGSDVAASAASPTPTSAEELAGGEKEVAVYTSKGKLSIFRSARFVWANAGVALLAAVSWITWLMTREPDINQLLAQAYRDQRTVQLRMLGAKHSPIQTERGPAGVHLSPPASLLNAESSIRQGLRKSPENQALLEQEGRAELLEGDYRSAIATLQRAKDLPNTTPIIFTDLATAYFERAEGEDRPTDYGTAAELLSIVLQRNPDDEIALFNRAIVYERLLLYEKAMNDWERYLHVSRDKGWDGEVQQYLARLKQKLR